MTVEEAKARLRAKAAEHSLLAWVRHHPLEGALGAVLFGVLVGGSSRLSRVLRESATLLLKLL